MPGFMGFGERRIIPRPEAHVPAEHGQGGVLNHTAHAKVDPASHAGASGAPGGVSRGSGRSPSIRAGIERGAVLAGTGVAVGAAIAIPRVLGSGDGLFDAFTHHDGGGDKKGGDDKHPNRDGGVADTVAEALGVNTGLLVLGTTAGILIWLAKRRSK